MLDVVAFIVAISVLVAVHEYGHFWVARKLGFKVLRFSIGFGKPIWTWTGRDPDRIEYWLSSIPLGGYVKMLDEREGAVAANELPRAFNRRPIPQRIAVLLAGPGFNFLFAVVAYWILFVTGIPGIRPIVDTVTPGSTAAESGLRLGDVITRIGGQPTATLEDAILAIYDELLGDGLIDLEVQALDGEPREVELDARGRLAELTASPDSLFPGLGFEPGPGASLVPPEIVSVTPGSAAEEAGLRVGDRILEAAAEPIRASNWVQFIQARPGETVPVRVARDGGEVELSLTIRTAQENGAEIGQIGTTTRARLPEDVVARISAEQRYGVLAAIPRSIAKAWEMTALTVRLLGHMLVGDVSLRSVSGPIMIADYAGDSAAAGFTAFLAFLALVSISLGIMNLLPVPILDGGQIVFQVAEWLKGAPLSERTLALSQQAGLAFLIVLMSFVFYNDLTRIFST